MASHSKLFPELAELEAAENRLTQKLSAVRQQIRDRTVEPSPRSHSWRADLATRTFEQSEDLDTLIDWTISALSDGIVQMTHPGYLGLFNPAPSFPSECADRIANVFNPQICVWSHAPAAVEIEQHVIAQVAKRAGYPSGSGGHFTSGGAEANATAVLCALTAKCPDYGEQGISAFAGQPRLYASKESHLAWLKLAHATGIGRSAVQLIDTDGSGRMDATLLERAVTRDIKAGHVPVMIAATAGTTNAGMVDPLEACAEIAQRHGIWCHVDAAWGGALIASSDRSSVLAGIEKADSITIDAHKWFATTMAAGMFLTRRTDIPAEVYRVEASYMPESEAANDYYVTSAQWSRRFVGLRLFLSLGAAGWAGHAEHVEHSVRLIKRLSEGLRQAGWKKENKSEMAVACFMPPEGVEAVDGYVEKVNASGQFWVSKAVFEGRSVFRACVTNGRTSETDIDELIAFLAR